MSSDRQAEINLFSQMAGGQMDHDTSESFLSSAATTDEDDDLPSRKSTPSEGMSSTRGRFPEEDTQDSATLFTKAVAQAEVNDTGTFAARSTSTRSSAASRAQSNLAAAAAAFGDNSMNNATPPPPPPMPLAATSGFPGPALHRELIGMHSERVLMPRPLCFGPLLPPRVVRECRKHVQQVMDEKGKGPDVRISDFPPSLRNLVGCIQTYGHGISPFPVPEGEEEAGSFVGNPYVETFQPVWGESTRAEREVTRKRRRMHRISLSKSESGLDPNQDLVEENDGESSSFSPSKLETAAASSPEWGTKVVDAATFRDWITRSTDDVSSIVSGSSQASGLEPIKLDRHGSLDSGKSSLASVEPMTDTNLFSLWARGEVAADHDGSSSNLMGSPRVGSGLQRSVLSKSQTIGSPTGTLGTPTSLAKPTLAKAQTVGNPSASTPTTSVMTNTQLFSQWARGESPSMSSLGAGSPRVRTPRGSGSNIFTTAWANGSGKDMVASKHSVDKALFSQWARGGGGSGADGSIGDDGSSKNSATSKGSRRSGDGLASPRSTESEKDQFSKWALAAAGGGSSEDLGSPASQPVIDQPVLSMSRSSSVGRPTDTFRHVDPITDDSDDDSVVGSEMKKRVGMDDNISAALQSLANEANSSSDPGGRADASMESAESMTATEANALLWQLGQTTLGGRPLSNLELTNGCVPLYDCDDPSLPAEADLGVYETKEEQLRSIEVQRSQEIIDKHSKPNIFGSIACPNPAMGPDDNHAWNSRSVPLVKAHGHASPAFVPIRDAPDSRARQQSAQHRRSTSPTPRRDEATEPFIMPPPVPMRHTRSAGSAPANFRGDLGKNVKRKKGNRHGTAATRYGWWSVPDDESKGDDDDDEEQTDDTSSLTSVPFAPPGTGQQQQNPIQLPPTEHSADSVMINTRLSPTPAKLREENFPLTHLHAATSAANSLPFLSDRPPSWRYLQIETKAVGFPPVGGEIEPLFCSLAIYHVETQSNLAGGPRAAPLPNRQRCGRVTEVLHFDVVTDTDIETKCRDALWPFLRDVEDSDVPEKDRTQGTRCGVFPIPSNLTVANLYAIIIVHKVLSAQSDIDVYMNKEAEKKSKQSATPPRGNASTTSTSTSLAIDLEKFRQRAERAACAHGRFLMQFAFGVAPLLQVFGTDVPTVPGSRGVQVPLFRLSPGQSEKALYHHIMVMLYPRADHKASGISGPAPLTNGGSAVLVMRNFGYLGLQSVVDKRSALARHRLIDFSGELQIRERTDDDAPELGPRHQTDRDYVLPPWRKHFIAEPTENGGRNVVELKSEGQHVAPSEESKSENGKSKNLYAQELAPLPLQLAPPTGSWGRSPMNSPARPPRAGYPSQSLDCEPSFHSSFFNEMLCIPRLLRSCPKKTITIKVEVREMEWSQPLDGYIAHPLSDGPCIHNQRRGPTLISDAYTTCVPASSVANFLDEFKFKLPLLLQRNVSIDGLSSKRLVILFSAYKISSTRGAWRKIFGGKSSGESVVSGTSVDVSQPRLKFLASGFLPVTTDGDTCCLIENGLHDVKLVYSAEPYEEIENGLLLRRITFSPKIAAHSKSDSSGSAGERMMADTDEAASTFESESAMSESRYSEGNIGDTSTVSGLSGSSSGGRGATDLMSLQVRIVVHSALHAQSAVLTEFLQSVPDPPRPLSKSELQDTTKWKPQRDEMIAIVRKNGRADPTRISGDPTVEVLPTTDLCNPAACAPAMIASHFVRIISQLLTLSVAGPGEPSTTWANPSALIPLRVEAFSSLLQLLCSTSIFMAKNGVTQLDGKHKWNTTTLAQVVALMLDEKALFPAHVKEPFDPSTWKSKKPTESPSTRPERSERKVETQRPKPRRRHIRSDSDNLIMPSGPTASTFKGENVGLSASSSLPADLSNKLTSMKTTFPDLSDIEIQATIPEPMFEADTFRADTKAEFRSALIAGSADPFADGLTSLFGGGIRDRRKFNTLPPSALAAIPEDIEALNYEEKTTATDSLTTDGSGRGDPADTEMVRLVAKRATRQFRRPKLNKPKDGDQTKSQGPPKEGGGSIKSDEDIENAGKAFLDVVGQNLGYAKVDVPAKVGRENNHVGRAHHRKTRSRSSVDWSLPNLTTGNEIDVAEFPSPISANKSDSKADDDDETDFTSELDLAMSSLKEEGYTSQVLPNYLDRLVGMCAQSGSRWYPFVYEIIIFQWASLLSEQRKNGDKKISGILDFEGNEYPRGYDTYGGGSLRESAGRLRGVTITSAPILFELIKKSLGYRLHSLLRRVDESTRTSKVLTPPVIKLDSSVVACLEYLVVTITDACLDSRNYDSWDFRQTSIDVNDALVRFIRDLFAFVEPDTVHKLVLLYFSRYVVKESKRSQDRDSKIALRCSWEISKLRLNAVATFVRMRDFVRINSPQMLNWGPWPLKAPFHATRKFFHDATRCFLDLNMHRYTVAENSPLSSKMEIPEMKPHWLAEIVTDVCVAGAEHQDPFIHHRAASLLHEMLWSQSQEARATGMSGVVASMYLTLLTKILKRADYLSMLPAKCQLRKDILPCIIFVLQSAPPGLLRGYWRRLCLTSEGRVSNGGLGSRHNKKTFVPIQTSPSPDDGAEPDIFDLFCLLNLAVGTFEYDGCDDNVEPESPTDEPDQVSIWKKEYLPGIQEDANYLRAERVARLYRRISDDDLKEETRRKYCSSSSRKWASHDASLVIITQCRTIVREMLYMSTLAEGNPTVSRHDRLGSRGSHLSDSLRSIESARDPSARYALHYSDEDRVLFVRGATSVYLHTLSTKQSDIVTVKALVASVEIMKIFGVAVFLEAVGGTFQHWMRVVLFRCGARRADVRVEALEFLAWILRVTWDGYGSFSRVRVPLLAIQSEVMNRHVRIATFRFYREQRRLGMDIQSLTTDSAEATLAPLWRTLNRLHFQSASTNVAFRSALTRLAEMMKKIYRAFIAEHALAILNKQNSSSPNSSMNAEEEENLDVAALLQSRRITAHRIIMQSAGYCKQFLGPNKAASLTANFAHNEAIEDAFLDAALVFSATELPLHRVAWLHRLADFHKKRGKFAEEATCRFRIHATYRQAAPLHTSLWTSIPFLPWANAADLVGIEGDGANIDADDLSEGDDRFDDPVDGFYENQGGKQIDRTDSFRRMFYRVPNSVRFGTKDLATGGNHNLFFGVTFASEYGPATPWHSLREMEGFMIEEAEEAAELYLKAGITESSRFAWGLATQFYAEKFIYSKLSHSYMRLAMVVASKIPIVDTTDQALELSHPLGRFYRVWFHGGAPDDLIGAEFVYRADITVKLEKFGKYLQNVIKSILPDNTPIDLVLDDGRVEEKRATQRRPLAPVTLEPVKVKITPLRPLLRVANTIRGTPEWFHRYTDVPSDDGGRNRQFLLSTGPCRPSPRARVLSHRGNLHSRSFSSSMFASGDSSNSRRSDNNFGIFDGFEGSNKQQTGLPLSKDDLVGVDRFSFLQPVRRDRNRSSRDWLKASSDLADKNLRVTVLNVARTFPACVSRQAVASRVVFTQSPLEAGVDAISTWCSVLFRTAVATKGLHVLGEHPFSQGIGKGAVRVISDCLHNSRVKEMGLVLLKRQSYVKEEFDAGGGTIMFDYPRLSDEEINRLQVRLAKGIVVFLELLHILICRNREMLLHVVGQRKRAESESVTMLNPPTGSSSIQRTPSHDNLQSLNSPPGTVRRTSSRDQSRSNTPAHSRVSSNVSVSHQRGPSVDSLPTHGRGLSHMSGGYDSTDGAEANIRGQQTVENVPSVPPAREKTDANLAVQSELQRSFSALCKAMYPVVSSTLLNETPSWLKQSGSESYFSYYTYRDTKLAMADELCFEEETLPPGIGSATVGATPEDLMETRSYTSSVGPGASYGRLGPQDSPNGSFSGSLRSRGSRHRELEERGPPLPIYSIPNKRHIST